MIRNGLVGIAVDVADLEACLQQAIPARWKASLNVLPTGKAGWYRRLDYSDRVGFVASAQGILALRATGSDLPELVNVAATTCEGQRDDGAWPFLSNLSNVGVVDSTAWCLMALAQSRHRDALAAADAASRWLKDSALPEGGWGICRGESFRCYSTAVAVRALSRAGEGGCEEVSRAVRRLLSAADPATGAWQSQNATLSVPITSHVLIALSESGRLDQSHEQVDLSANWLRAVSRTTSDWTHGVYAGLLEEVEVKTSSEIRRIEYRHFSIAVAVEALSKIGCAGTPEVVSSVRRLLRTCHASGMSADKGLEHGRGTSWQLHDITAALSSFRATLPRGTVSVWTRGNRVVIHQSQEGIARRMARRHSVDLIGILAGVLAFAVVFSVTPIKQTAWLTVASAVCGPLLFGIAANFIYDFLRNSRR